METEILATLNGVTFQVFYYAECWKITITYIGLKTDEDGYNLIEYLSSDTIAKLTEACIANEEELLERSLEVDR